MRKFALIVILILCNVLVHCDLTDNNEDYLKPCLNKWYKFYSDDNTLDKVLEALEVNKIKRKVAKKAKPDIKLSVNDEGVYTFLTKVKLKQFTTMFRFGEEFNEVTMDGRKVKSVITLDKNTMTHVQDDGKHVTIIVHVFATDQVVETLQVGAVITKRIYKYDDE